MCSASKKTTDLTVRQLNATRLICLGRTDEQVSRELGYSIKYVGAIIRSVKELAQVETRFQLALWAFKERLVSIEWAYEQIVNGRKE